MDGIVVRLQGGKEAVNSLRRIGSAAPGIVAAAIHRVGEDIMGDSKENYVPVALGGLRASGKVEPPRTVSGNFIVELSFGDTAVDYARVVHENPRAGKTMGVSPSGAPYPRTQGGKPTWSTVGQWKYLETPWKAHAPRVPEEIQRRVEGELARIKQQGGGTI